MKSHVPTRLLIAASLVLFVAWTCATGGAPRPHERADDVNTGPGELYRGMLDCADSVVASCSFFYPGDNSTGASNVTHYDCEPFIYETGPEVVFWLLITEETFVTAYMDPTDCDLDLFLLTSCDEDSCIAFSTSLFPERIEICLTPGAYYLVVDGYQGAACPFLLDVSCEECPAGAVDEDGMMPERYALHPCTPNPFNPMTMIRFDLPKSSEVSLEICDVTGRRVRHLIDDRYEAGLHRVMWDGLDDSGHELAAGMYFYELRVNGEVIGIEKALIVR